MTSVVSGKQPLRIEVVGGGLAGSLGSSGIGIG